MSMADRDGYIWQNGQLVEWRMATAHVLTHSLHYGLAIFEGVRAYKTDYGSAIFRLHDHTERLFNSAKILGMALPFTPAQINQAHVEIAQANQLGACYFRPLAFYGSDTLSIAPKSDNIQVIVAAWPWNAYLGAHGLEKGIRVKTSSFTRHHVNITMCKAKASGNYLNSILAHHEAISNGYDEALLLDVNGFVAEGASENVFIIRKNKVYTPDLTSALEGITRDTVTHIIKDMGLELIEKRITRDEVYSADEAFFTGTAAEVIPICELDYRVIGNGIRGRITTEIQARFFRIVKGQDPQYAHWLYAIV